MAKKVESIEESTDIYITGVCCISKIPKDCFTKNNYGTSFRFAIGKLAKLGKNGETHYMKFCASQEEKARGVQDIFIGNFCTEWISDDNKYHKNHNISTKPPVKEKTQSRTHAATTDVSDVDDLPF